MKRLTFSSPRYPTSRGICTYDYLYRPPSKVLIAVLITSQEPPSGVCGFRVHGFRNQGQGVGTFIVAQSRQLQELDAEAQWGNHLSPKPENPEPSFKAKVYTLWHIRDRLCITKGLG